MSLFKKYQAISFNMEKVREWKIVQTTSEKTEISFDEFYKFVSKNKNDFEPLSTMIPLSFKLQGVRYNFDVSNKAVTSILEICKDAILNDFNLDRAKLYYLGSDFVTMDAHSAKRLFYVEGDRVLPVFISDSWKEGERIEDFIIFDKPDVVWNSQNGLNYISDILAYRKYYKSNDVTMLEKIIDLGIEDPSFLIHSEDYYRDHLSILKHNRLRSIETLLVILNSLIVLSAVTFFFFK